jgi:hypothetical protein
VAGALVVALSAGAVSGLAQTQPQIDPALRDAAMKQMKPPQGVGGCIFLAIAVDVRREALVSALSGQSPKAAFQAAVAEVAPKCASRPYSRSDAPVVGATVSALNRSASALALAGEFGVGQETLDRAWLTASAEEKAGYYAFADQFLARDTPFSGSLPDVGPLATRAGLTPAQYVGRERWLGVYFLYTALSEKAEAALAKPAR